jgi:hypothetical protein
MLTAQVYLLHHPLHLEKITCSYQQLVSEFTVLSQVTHATWHQHTEQGLKGIINALSCRPNMAGSQVRI